MSQKGDGRRGKAVKKFNVAAAEFDPTSVSAAVAGFVPGAVQPGSPAMKPAGSPALAAMAATGAIPGIYGSMGMAGVAGGASGAVAPQETRVIFRSVPKEVDTVALIKNCEMSLGHVVGCDFSSSTGLGVVTFQLPASAAMAVQCSGMPVFPGMPPFHISLADHAALDTPCSNTLVVKGLPHHASRSDALRAVCAVRPLPSAMELHLRERGEVWARYEDLDAAAEAALALSGSTPPEAEAEGGSGALEVAYKRGDPAHLSEKNLISYNEEGVPVQTLHRPGAGGGGGAPWGGPGGRGGLARGPAGLWGGACRRAHPH